MNHILLISKNEDSLLQLQNCLRQDEITIHPCLLDNRFEIPNESAQADLVLLVLDWTHSENVCYLKKLKQALSAPIIAICDESSEIVRSYYLDIGADDLIGFPIPEIETNARIKACLRRLNEESELKQGGPFHIGQITFYPNEYKIIKNGSVVDLTKDEQAILSLLAKDMGATIKRSSLLSDLRRMNALLTGNALNIHISRLRNKLGENRNKSYIKTIWGVGYRLDA